MERQSEINSRYFHHLSSKDLMVLQKSFSAITNNQMTMTREDFKQSLGVLNTDQS